MSRGPEALPDPDRVRFPASAFSSTASLGTCPICGATILWAQNTTDEADHSFWHAPLEPAEIATSEPGSDIVDVIFEPSGAARVVTTHYYKIHICPLGAMEALLGRIDRMGLYTAELLTTPCPVRSCRAGSGMLCLSPRREVQHRPHGARMHAAKGEDPPELG